MSVMKNNDGTEMIMACSCGCEDSIHLKVVLGDDESYIFLSYMNGCFYSEQGGLFSSVRTKLKKICAILFNKDYYYSEVIMSKTDFLEFKDFINQF